MTRAKITIELTLDLDGNLESLSDNESFNYAMTEFDGLLKEATKIKDYEVDLNSFYIDD